MSESRIDAAIAEDRRRGRFQKDPDGDEDSRKAWALAKAQHPHGPEALALCRHSRHRAELLVVRHWRTIERIAAALLVKKRLGAVEMSRLWRETCRTLPESLGCAEARNH